MSRLTKKQEITNWLALCSSFVYEVNYPDYVARITVIAPTEKDAKTFAESIYTEREPRLISASNKILYTDGK